jgi:hypothetical protein
MHIWLVTRANQCCCVMILWSEFEIGSQAIVIYKKMGLAHFLIKPRETEIRWGLVGSVADFSTDLYTASVDKARPQRRG